MSSHRFSMGNKNAIAGAGTDIHVRGTCGSIARYGVVSTCQGGWKWGIKSSHNCSFDNSCNNLIFFSVWMCGSNKDRRFICDRLGGGRADSLPINVLSEYLTRLRLRNCLPKAGSHRDSGG